ncbi:RNA polymerase sigma-70 factor [Chitinophaga sp.]|uniref:RNA polymerase sigma-70 factor n=1 Tax=Chitinophaga sp. TaxID=1869181 RepID=UPI002F92AADF
MLQGEEWAFDAIYAQYAIPLLNAAYKRLKSKEEAKEVVQEVFISLFINKSAIRHTENLGGYLHNTLRYKILDIIRADLRHATHREQIGRQQEPFDQIEHQLENKELEIRLQRCIHALPDKCREAFLLSRYEHLSYKAIAEQLNISVNTVEKHIGKALRILRVQLGENGLLLLLLLLGIQ